MKKRSSPESSEEYINPVEINYTGMILFSIIDSYFINKQEGNKNVGLKGINKIEKQINCEEKFFLYLRKISLFFALKIFFEKTELINSISEYGILSVPNSFRRSNN